MTARPRPPVSREATCARKSHFASWAQGRRAAHRLNETRDGRRELGGYLGFEVYRCPVCGRPTVGTKVDRRRGTRRSWRDFEPPEPDLHWVRGLDDVADLEVGL